jgi:hypothetical protein
MSKNINKKDELIDQIFIDFRKYCKSSLSSKKKKEILNNTMSMSSLDDDVDEFTKYFNNSYEGEQFFFSFVQHLDYDIPHSVYISLDIIKLLQHALLTI